MNDYYDIESSLSIELNRYWYNNKKLFKFVEN